MKKNLFAATALLALCCAPLAAQQSQSYTVQGTVKDAAANGKTIYILRYDDEALLDSTVVEGGKFLFKGQTDVPAFCRITTQPAVNFILEGGNITIQGEKNNQPSGTSLNRDLADLLAKTDSINAVLKAKREDLSKQTSDTKELSNLWSEFLNTSVIPVVSKMSKEFFAQHNNDAVGEYLIRSNFSLKDDLAVWEQTLNSFGPWLKSRKTVQKAIEQVENSKKSAEGNMFTDFVGKGIDGKEVSLSEYVGKGKYVLVDFWASWCGPCKGEIPNLAKLHNEYKDKGLVVLGLFVWDKDANLKKSMDAEGITWPQIIDSNNKVTALYGVSGIPQIILFGPDGTILKRDLRGAKMVQTVSDYMK